SVLAGSSDPRAEAAWVGLTAGNTQRRPVALMSPFGGAEPLKGYVERTRHELAEQLRRLIVEGFFVILLPNGTPWGSVAHARRALDILTEAERAQVEIAPSPGQQPGTVSYRHNGEHTVPYASYLMRLATYFVRYADLIVTVEGWMVHAAYCLGKRY